MAHSGRRRRQRSNFGAPTRTKAKQRKPRHRKPELKHKIHAGTSKNFSCCSSSTTSAEDLPKISEINLDAFDHSDSPCSTPKAQRFQIPETLTCPPAPKKQRVDSTCSYQRPPISFFASPDLELFFHFSLGNTSLT